MELYLTDKLAGELAHYQDKDFLKAAMAVFVLTAQADGRIDPAERRLIERTIKAEPGLREFDCAKAAEILDRYIHALQSHGEAARRVLDNKVRRMAGQRKKARTLMRAAYLIVKSDHVVQDAERLEFQRLCRLVGLEPGTVWSELEMTAR